MTSSPPPRPDRRRIVGAACAALPLAVEAAFPFAALAAPATAVRRRTRPGDPDWPDAAAWQQLDAAVGGSLRDRLAVRRLPCRARVAGVRRSLPPASVGLGDDVALTQTFGWVAREDVVARRYAVAARSASDAAAPSTSRERRLRLVVKGGGHSYQGTSNAPVRCWSDANMKNVVVHEASFSPARWPHRHSAPSLRRAARWDARLTPTTRASGACRRRLHDRGVAGLVQAAASAASRRRSAPA
jgi:hypothetical protein